MHPDGWNRVEELFHAALQCTPQQRATYLDEACADQPELRREVESLLDETAVAEKFMERPVGVSVASLDFTPQTSLEGRTLGHYRIGPLVGSGGMAEVYRARDTRLERDVAIKVLHNVQSLDGDSRERIYREARLLATLNHPNIAAIYGIEETDGLCGLVLEFVEGDTLSEHVERSSVAIPIALDIARQIAAGLHAAHVKGIIHRDLKPANIKITPDGTVKIVDFGIAKLLRALDSQGGSGLDISREGMVIGTPRYMSPEQARGKAIDARTDIWAFGCVLYELRCGKPAFEGETPTDLIVKIATEEPDWNSIPRAPEAVSIELARLIRKCMQKDADLRYQSVSEFSADLQVVQQGCVVREPLPKPGVRESDDDFVLPGRFALSLFLLAQAGYVALYVAAMYHVEAIARILDVDFQIPERPALIGTLVLAMCGIAVRIYLITAVGWRHPLAGRKFTLLFPVLLLLDSIWAASPLLFWRNNFGLAFTGVAMLAYVPFAQRTLMRTIYPRRLLRT